MPAAILSSKCVQKICKSLEDHIGLDLDGVKDCKDGDAFAKAVEVAAKNHCVGRFERKNGKKKRWSPPARPVQLSFQSQEQRDNATVAAFNRLAGDDAAEDDVVSNFLKLAED